jgi:hypothetical protein
MVLLQIFQISKNISRHTVKRVQDYCPDNLVDEIVACYTQEDKDNRSEEEQELEPLVTYHQALFAIDTLLKYKKQNKYRNTELLSVLRAQERDISARCFASKEQVTLDRWCRGRYISI